MQLLLFKNFTKRINSTKRPDITQPDRSVTISAKDVISVEHPTFKVSNVDLDINYAYFNGKYYYVDDVTLSNVAIYELHCSMDHLATYKDQIQSSSQYVLYASTGYNANIVDNRIGVKTTKDVLSETGSGTFSIVGSYVVQIANVASNGEGFTASYNVNKTDLASIAAFLMGASDSFYDELWKQFNDPYSSLISCLWLPIGDTEISGASEYVFFGKEVSTVSAKKISNPIVLKSSTVTIPWKYTDFRNSAPYTSASIFLPYYGMLDLNVNDLIGAASLGVDYAIDVLTGDCNVLIKKGTVTLQTLSFNIAAQCATAQTSVNAASVLTGSAGVVGGLVTAGLGVASGNVGAVAGGGMAIAGALGSAIMQYNQRSTSYRGSTQGRSSAQMGNQVKLYLFCQDTEDPSTAAYIAKNGRPVMTVQSLSGKSGFVQCADASVDIPGNSADKETINSSLNSGIYIE